MTTFCDDVQMEQLASDSRAEPHKFSYISDFHVRFLFSVITIILFCRHCCRRRSRTRTNARKPKKQKEEGGRKKEKKRKEKKRKEKKRKEKKVRRTVYWFLELTVAFFLSFFLCVCVCVSLDSWFVRKLLAYDINKFFALLTHNFNWVSMRQTQHTELISTEYVFMLPWYLPGKRKKDKKRKKL